VPLGVHTKTIFMIAKVDEIFPAFYTARQHHQKKSKSWSNLPERKLHSLP
jgi:hypothetical protein